MPRQHSEPFLFKALMYNSSHVQFIWCQLYLPSIYSISQKICTRFFTLLCFVVVIHWLIFPYPSSLLHWHCGNLTIATVPAKQPWWIWINTSCEFIMNDCITTTKQSTTKPCAYFLGYTVACIWACVKHEPGQIHYNDIKRAIRRLKSTVFRLFV